MTCVATAVDSAIAVTGDLEGELPDAGTIDHRTRWGGLLRLSTRRPSTGADTCGVRGRNDLSPAVPPRAKAPEVSASLSDLGATPASGVTPPSPPA